VLPPAPSYCGNVRLKFSLLRLKETVGEPLPGHVFGGLTTMWRSTVLWVTDK